MIYTNDFICFQNFVFRMTKMPEYLWYGFRFMQGYPDPDSDDDSDTEWVIDDFPFYSERVYYDDNYWYPFTGNYN